MKIKSILAFVLVFIVTTLAMMAQPYVAFVENGKYGLKNASGELLLEPIYDFVNAKTVYHDDGVLVRVADSCFLVSVKTKQISLLSEALKTCSTKLHPAIISPNNKYGYIDTQGCVVIDEQWDFAGEFYDGMARVVDGMEGDIISTAFPTSGKTAFIDTLGNYIIPPIHSYIDLFQGNVARFTNGKYVCKDQFGCENPYAGSKWGLIDKSGNIVIPAHKYDFIDAAAFDAKNNRVIFGVIVGDKMGYIDVNGVEITPLKRAKSFQQVWKRYLTR